MTGFHDTLIQQQILNVGLTDHHLIYCKRNITWKKRGGHKEIKLCSLKNYTVDGNKNKFVDYENFDNVNDTYWNFIQKFMEVIDKVAPF